MAELTEHEIWVIQVYFESRGFGSHRINDILVYLLRLSFGRGESVIEGLIEKKVLSRSPDGHSVKFTDYGVELYQATVRAQKEWESQPIIKVATLDRGQVLIRAGETFRANRILREILSQVRQEVAVIDPYVGAPLFDLLEPLGERVIIRVLTSDRMSKDAVPTYKAFKVQYPRTEMRTIVEKVLHDRYILWDHAHGFHLGHSIKDLGTKDAQLTLLTPTADPQWTLFEQRWAEATPVS